MDRIAALGGGIAIQHRMAFQGEYFRDRYGSSALKRTPPIRKCCGWDCRWAAGTDATRVASYNPFVSLYWLVTGKTVGGLSMYDGRQSAGSHGSSAALDCGQQLVLDRTRSEGFHRARPTRGSGGAFGRLLFGA